ncbi:MAG: helix-turn-helix transcriptional regulator [Thaumarchaeota archaeon]|nr:helix-turn-helix transcriptional regulator [Nitrososphaerota archaeon]
MKQLRGDDSEIAPLKVEFESCPVQASLGTLGRKWALLILRNIALFDKHRFNEMLKVTPGLTKRVLSMRLRELEEGGYLKVVERGLNYSKWDLTEKGRDALPILMALVQFGSKWYASQVFEDKMPRALQDVFRESYIREIMKSFFIELPVVSYERLRKN